MTEILLNVALNTVTLSKTNRAMFWRNTRLHCITCTCIGQTQKVHRFPFCYGPGRNSQPVTYGRLRSTYSPLITRGSTDRESP